MFIPLSCGMLVDQERRIAGDPVGYKCEIEAVDTIVIDGMHYMICERCLGMDRERLSVLPWPRTGGLTRQEAIDKATENIKAAIDLVFSTVHYVQ